ncbi:MAG: LLM class flavin-dependent oxidoreductase [Canibacter sp.]
MVARSVLDLATVTSGNVNAALQHSATLAQAAEAGGYQRIWYAEHHNMPSIASSATAVLIGHIASNTKTIRVGAGGVMLPNHSPLAIAEQFGTLAELHPRRIDLGLGRAPGGDMETFRALRRPHSASESFPSDVQELQRYLSDELARTEVNAYPGRGTKVPLTILGSSMFGASLAAQLGLPYAFASHFAPQMLQGALRHYRENFKPSEQLDQPYAYAAINVIAADTETEANDVFAAAELERVRMFLSRGRSQELSTEAARGLMETPAGLQIRDMMRYTAIGDAKGVREELAAFEKHTNADELICVFPAAQPEQALRSLEIAAPAGD